MVAVFSFTDTENTHVTASIVLSQEGVYPITNLPGEMFKVQLPRGVPHDEAFNKIDMTGISLRGLSRACSDLSHTVWHVGAELVKEIDMYYPTVSKIIRERND